MYVAAGNTICSRVASEKNCIRASEPPLKSQANDPTPTGGGGFTLGDAAQVILNEACNVDLECITNAFLASPGVNPRKVGIEWVKNHFR